MPESSHEFYKLNSYSQNEKYILTVRSIYPITLIQTFKNSEILGNIAYHQLPVCFRYRNGQRKQSTYFSRLTLSTAQEMRIGFASRLTSNLLLTNRDIKSCLQIIHLYHTLNLESKHKPTALLMKRMLTPK